MGDEELQDQLVSLLLLVYKTMAAKLACIVDWIQALASIVEMRQSKIDTTDQRPQTNLSVKLPYLCRFATKP